MKSTDAVSVFDTLDQFYADNPARDRSGEVDFGVHWTYPHRRHPAWRVSWVEDTGELYAIQQSPKNGPVIVYAIIPSRDELEQILDGWVDACGPGGIAWLQRKLGWLV